MVLKDGSLGGQLGGRAEPERLIREAGQCR
jgi:hypothetical protein